MSETPQPLADLLAALLDDETLNVYKPPRKFYEPRYLEQHPQVLPELRADLVATLLPPLAAREQALQGEIAMLKEAIEQARHATALRKRFRTTECR